MWISLLVGHIRGLGVCVLLIQLGSSSLSFLDRNLLTGKWDTSKLKLSSVEACTGKGGRLSPHTHTLSKQYHSFV